MTRPDRDPADLDLWSATLVTDRDPARRLAAARALAAAGPAATLALCERAGPAELPEELFTVLADAAGADRLAARLGGARSCPEWVWRGALRYLPERVPAADLRAVYRTALVDPTVPAAARERVLDLLFAALVDAPEVVRELRTPLEHLAAGPLAPPATAFRALDLVLAAVPAGERAAIALRLLLRAGKREAWRLWEWSFRRLVRQPAPPAPVQRKILRQIEHPKLPPDLRHTASTNALHAFGTLLDAVPGRGRDLETAIRLLLRLTTEDLRGWEHGRDADQLRLRPLLCIGRALAVELRRGGTPSLRLEQLLDWFERAAAMRPWWAHPSAAPGHEDPDLEAAAIAVLDPWRQAGPLRPAALRVLAAVGGRRAIPPISRLLEGTADRGIAARARTALAHIRARLGGSSVPGALSPAETPAEQGRLSVSGEPGGLSPATEEETGRPATAGGASPAPATNEARATDASA